MIQTKDEIVTGLIESFGAMSDYIRTLDQSQFENAQPSKWSAGQQVQHLIKSVRPINWVLYLPVWIIKPVFGKMNRAPRDYDALLKKYHDKLSLGGTASSPFVPSAIPFEQKEKLVLEFNSQLQTLCKHLNKMSDKTLDSLILPHPLLGKLCLREMMYFTIFHTLHHLKSIKER